MSLSGLDWQTIHLPFTAGLDTKAHAYALDPPGLSSAKNVEFDELGALRLRKPYTGIGTDIFGGGTLSSVRKLAVVDGELLCFTATGLYAWSETLSKWVSRGTHLAVAVEEASVFGNPTDQVYADRAELAGVIVYVWCESLSGSVTSYLAAVDAVTKSTVIAPTSFGAGLSRPRIIALSTKFLVTWIDAVGLYGKTITPSSPSFSVSSATSMDFVATTMYDIVKDPGADQAFYVAANAGTADYLVGICPSSMTGLTTSTKARTADGAVALAYSTESNRIQIVRTDGTNLKGDILNGTTLADVHTNQTVGTVSASVTEIACAYHTASEGGGGQYRCHIFWTEVQTVQHNWVDTGATVGTAEVLLVNAAVASRAFIYGGEAFLWVAFGFANNSAGSGTALGYEVAAQNTYYLYRYDGHLTSKAASLRAGGSTYYTGHLPGVALISGTTVHAWAGTTRDFVQLGGDQTFGDQSYADRTPRDVVFTFDSDEARRTVQVGRTLYVSGGLILQYDGEGLVEVGFEQFPWYIATLDDATAGSVAAGKYSYKTTLRWQNGRGETERSTTAIGEQLTVGGANRKPAWSSSNLGITRKTGSRRAPAIEAWRTVTAAPIEGPYYLVTSRDPGATGDNGYVSNDPTATVTGSKRDNFTDAVLATKEQSPDDATTVQRFAPPGASILLGGDTRLFLAGVPGEPLRVWYSLLRSEGEVAAFNRALSFSIPSGTGAITGLGFLNGALVVFTGTALYIVPGDGFDNLGNGGNYGPPQLVASDAGALSHDTIASTPGGLIFLSAKGWYRLTPGQSLDYIGAKAEDYNSDTWVAAQVVESQHQIRFLSSSRMLIFDYLVGQWSEWDQAGGRALAIWRGTPVLLDTAPREETSDFSAVDYYMEIVTGWIKPAGLQGFARIKEVMLLGLFKASHRQAISLGYDYDTSYTDTRNMDFVGLTVGDPTQVRQGPSRQRCQSLRVKVTIRVDAASAFVNPPPYDAVTLTGLSFKVGIRRGLYPRLPATQKQ